MGWRVGCLDFVRHGFRVSGLRRLCREGCAELVCVVSGLLVAGTTVSGFGGA